MYVHSKGAALPCGYLYEQLRAKDFTLAINCG